MRGAGQPSRARAAKIRPPAWNPCTGFPIAKAQRFRHHRWIPHDRGEQIAPPLNERAGLDLYIDRDKWTVGDMKGHRSYQVGMYEPGVCAVKQDLTKLYSWALKPTAANTGGAMGRVHAADAWKAIQLSLTGDLSLADWEPEYTLEGTRMNSVMFKLITLAEGNFIRPLGMELPEDGGVGEGHETGASHFATVRRKNMRKVAAAGLVSAAALWKKPLPAAVLLALYGKLLSPNPP